MDGFKVRTSIGSSKIAGNGRFFDENVKKGTIVREQKIGSDFLLKFENEADLIKYISSDTQEDFLDKLERVRHFFHTVPDNSKFHRDCVFLNEPFMYTNHSFEPNIMFEYTKEWKYTVTTRDVKTGEEMFQNYLNFANVNWYENFLKKYNFTSSRKFASELNKKMVNEEKI